MSISPISQWFSPGDEQHMNNVNQLIRYNNQLTGVQQYFTNIAAMQNMMVL